MSREKMTMTIYQDGRLQIPVYMQNRLRLKAGDKVNVRLEKGEIIITPMKKKCVICEAEDGLKIVNKQYVCLKCVESVVDSWLKNRYDLGEDNNG